MNRPGQTGRSARRPRGRLVPLGVLVAAVAAAIGLVVWEVQTAPSALDGQVAGPTTWSSGAAGDGVATGAFGRWRGSPVGIAATWNDSLEAQTNQWTLQPGAEYGSWDADLDLSVGAIYKDQGESWSAAVDGAYDERWATALRAVERARSGREGTIYLRFAHEFNGEWEPWSVTSAEVDDFRAAWSRFRDLQQEILPQAQLVFCPTSETSSSLGLRWTDATPDADDVDVMAVDYYNQYPFVDDKASFDDLLDEVDPEGAPRGLDAHRVYAGERGEPFAISEWNSNADMGDSAAFMVLMRRWLEQHAGSGAGEVLYEIQFNVSNYGSGQFMTHPVGRQPDASAAYRTLW
ncbi:MAG: hypothetical protein LH468_08060 [Nocardioides sp.]|nr:hypothetical protein [Nocardioides sp.]